MHQRKGKRKRTSNTDQISRQFMAKTSWDLFTLRENTFFYFTISSTFRSAHQDSEM